MGNNDDLITAYAAHLRQASKTPDTIRTYCGILDHADRTLPCGLDIATTSELREYIWRTDLASSSRATAYGAIVSFYRWALRAGELSFDPSTDIDRPAVPQGRPRVATTEQVRVIVTTPSDPYQLWGTIAAYGGLRCIEISRLRREHITPDVINVFGKGNKVRRPPTHPLVWQAVEHLPPGPITDLHQQEISSNFKKYCLRLGFGDLSMHRLRGWYLTHSYRATKDLLACQRNAGHSNPRTTAGYIDIPHDDSRAAVMGLPAF